MKYNQRLWSAILLAASFSLYSPSASASVVITHEVKANTINSVTLAQDATHVKFIPNTKHGVVNFDVSNLKATYKPNPRFYGTDTALVEFGKKKCLLFTCWINWSKETFIFNVGPGDNLGLKNAAQGMKVGVAFNDKFNNFDLNKEPYKTILREFSTVTLEYGHKWNFLSSAPGVYDFSNADKITRFANQHGIEVKGHEIVWYAALPQYVKNSTDKAVVESLLNQHVETVLNHYSCGAVDNSLCIKHWDILSELSASPSVYDGVVQSPSDGRYRNDHLYQVLGPEYIAKILTKSRNLRPDAVLWINDYNVEKAAKKADNLYSIVKGLVDNNVPLDGVGFQSHIEFDHSPIDLINNMQRYSMLGLKVHISELDVPAPSAADFSQEITTLILSGKGIGLIDLLGAPAIGRSERDQQIYYENYAAICQLMPNCNWVTQWGVSDDESWMRPFAKALTFNSDYSRKNTYFSMLKGLSGYGDLYEPSNGFFDSLSSPAGSVIELVAGLGL